MEGSEKMDELSVKKSIKKSENKKEKPVLKIVITFLMALFSVSMVIPFLWMMSASMKKPVDIWEFPIAWIPKYWYPENYKYILKMQPSVLLMYFNSIKISLINVTGAALTSSLAAYAYAKMKFKGRDILFLSVLATLMIPSQVLYVPRFVMFTWFDKFIKMMDSHNALILPGLFASFGLFLLKQFFMQVPDAICESAYIDGAGNFTTWWKIMLPVSKPALATFAIVVFTHHWNDYETPLIFIRNSKLYTIPLGLANFADENGLMYHYIMALSTAAIIPLFIVFAVGQKYFIKGLTAGAVKG
jgi:multiple sugar transport system permease protein